MVRAVACADQGARTPIGASGNFAVVVKELLVQGLHLVHLAAVEVLVILVQHIQELVADIKKLLLVCEVSLLVAGRVLLDVAYSPSLETN